MSPTAVTTPGRDDLGPRPTTFARVLRSEWIKARSLRSVWLTLVGMWVALVGFGLIAAYSATGTMDSPGGPPGFGGTDPVSTTMTGANLAILVVGVLGVLAGAREHSSGMIATTLAAVPARLPVLWSKALVFAGVTVPVVVTGVLLAFFGGTAILRAGGAASVSWADGGVARTVLGTAAYLVGIGLIGLALGMLLRSIAGGVSVLIGGLLFAPTLLGALLPDSWDAVLKYLPSNAGQSFTAVTTDTMLGVEAGAAVFAGWVALALAGAAVALARRDA